MNLKMRSFIGRLLHYCLISVLFLGIFLFSFFWYFCSSDFCSFQKLNILSARSDSVLQPRWRRLKANRQILSNWTTQIKRAQDVVDSDFVKSDFNINKSDVIVFLHIQNTGGSVFARHIVEDLDLDRPCRCKKNRRVCRCYRPEKYGSTWFFSRYTTGWKCGVHPDWAQLSSCVDQVMDEDEGRPVKRRYFFISVLRDPVRRFLSEFWHARQGQTWSSARHWCGGIEATETELPPCFDNKSLEDLSLDEFMNCHYNLGINRQARMLSDLALVGCYNSSSMSEEDRDLIILTSAKNNLHKMSFFGLSEFPKVSQYMFEVTFGMNFKVKYSVPREPMNRSARKELFKEISAKDIEKIKHINRLDIELYHYAKELLFFRFEKLKKIDPLFQNNFDNLARNNLSENWADREDFIDNLLD